MCNLYASQEPDTYACETRAVRLSGHCTSIRLESAFWEILEEIALSEGSTVGRFVSSLHDEVMERRGEVGNFASLLRVTCTLWLRQRRLERDGARENPRRDYAIA
ncbi:Intracellular proteinase i [Roseomonas mucosa]|jgi:predicted DNA-binding ribbon-helix-helix protein|uniref:Aryl-sulfate sulfotransferase n=1 Tax=Roseomonas mucosa TaxID=207340 RepID=A0A1S8D6I1_9PROT|nr:MULTISPECIES: ribbon-helix-helix domain-containing protein [Roseomonas]MBS5902487.1 ribbon-helix-helix domain-containing protein [Acetobacteraceae bacterium]MDT8262404.1 ribbon-helix-helix domain-containing protein [Roseomonas sp. DSM 102946]ATR22857.1 aryl-sulfate sulfotransferase [Roseomonas sp. FDAARGOS_362]AWV24104.1 Intracellular proteinase i [Roseomonas mucosa]MCG7353375.1 ribbon-helix-helix domain-containing protein [Roseomonas mucosa]